MSGTLNLGGGTATGSIIASGGTLGGLVVGGAGGGTFAYTRAGTVPRHLPAPPSIRRERHYRITQRQTLNLGALTGNPGGTVDISPNTASDHDEAAIPTASSAASPPLAARPPGRWARLTPANPFVNHRVEQLTPHRPQPAPRLPTILNANIDVTASADLDRPINPNSLRLNSATPSGRSP